MRTLALFFFAGVAAAQQLPVVTSVDPQPLAAQVLRLIEALQFLGEPLSAEETAELKQPATAVAEIQKILDRHCLVAVEINPESRVKVQEGPAKAELIEQGWRTFLVKVINQAGITPVLAALVLAASAITTPSSRRVDIPMAWAIRIVNTVHPALALLAPRRR